MLDVVRSLRREGKINERVTESGSEASVAPETL